MVLFWKWNLKMALFFENSVSCHEWHIALFNCGWALKRARLFCCWLISHFCRVLAAGSAHSWSCETSPVRAHVHSEGTVCILTTGPEPRKVPRVVSAETAHQPCPGPASSTSHHSRMRTEHDAATFRISFQNRITTYKYMLKNSGLAVGFFNFMFLFFKLMFLIITSKD